MVKSLMFDIPEVTAFSVALAEASWSPGAIGVPGVNAKCPEPLAVVVPIGFPSTKRSTCAPGNVRPVKVGVVSVVAVPSAGSSSTGGPRMAKPLPIDSGEVPPSVVCAAV